jgi:arginyl-tRNA synthetase
MQNLIHVIGNQVRKCLTDNSYDLTKQEPKIMASKHKGVDYCFHNATGISKLNKKPVEETLKLLYEYFKDNNFFNVSVSGNYLNFNPKKEFLVKYINSILDVKDLVIKPTEVKKIIIDYSSPNIAKDMHVGHLRSTIIGDSLANFYEILGHEVIRVNHIGDFGLQFGMIIQYIIDSELEDKISTINLQEIYTYAKKKYDTDNEFNKKAHHATTILQKGNNDDKIVKLWKEICDVSKKAYYDIYKKLGIKDMIEMGESYYVKYFESMINELKEKNMVKLDDGRLIIPTPIDSKNKGEGTLTVIKSDGGYTYDTTDLAALRYRLCDLKADIIYYVVDSGQSIHFKQIFYVAEKMGWINGKQHIEHINFGIVKGEDGKRIRSRKGENPKLIDLLDDAIFETTNVMQKMNPTLADNKEIINAIAYGSIKYADLAVCRTNDYLFSFDRMLSFKGNTMVYIMYGYVRSRAIIRNVMKCVKDIDFKVDPTELNDGDIGLMKSIPKLLEVIENSENDNMLHHICCYLYEMSDFINLSYNTQRCVEYDQDKNPIKINKSRAMIFKRISEIMELCFKIVGINPIEVI